MNLSMSRPSEPSVLTVGRAFASRSSPRETTPLGLRWDIELEREKALGVRRFFIDTVKFLRVFGKDRWMRECRHLEKRAGFHRHVRFPMDVYYVLRLDPSDAVTCLSSGIPSNRE
jgi:hypothetical protein